MVDWHKTGNAYVEYLVLASIVLLTTIAFYQANLKDEQAGTRQSVKSAFVKACESISGASCEDPVQSSGF